MKKPNPKAMAWMLTVVIVLASALWSILVMDFPYTVGNLPALYTTLLLVPGLLVMLITRAYRLWYAWLAIACLGWLVYPSALQMVIFLGLTWASMASVRPFQRARDAVSL